MCPKKIGGLQALLDVAGQAFLPCPDEEEWASIRDIHGLGSELCRILNQKNGFFAFESALRLFGTRTCEFSYGSYEWNSVGLWRFEYGGLISEDVFFFAEDVFGGQFAIADGGVWCFDPETAEMSFLADSLESWAARILEETNLLTGFPVAHAWQVRNGALRPRNRLIPKLPFVVGGAFTIDNLYELDGAKAMRVRGNLARQIHSLPDGAKVDLRAVD